MSVLSFVAHSAAETMALGKRLSGSFVSGDVLVLTGPLGAGKTVFVRGLVAGRGIAEDRVSSPSFGFVNEYPGNLPVYHIDLYRLNSVTELREIGWDDYLSRDGLVVIEWGEKAGELLPSRHYHMLFSIQSEVEREITLSLVRP